MSAVRRPSLPLSYTPCPFEASGNFLFFFLALFQKVWYTNSCPLKRISARRQAGYDNRFRFWRTGVRIPPGGPWKKSLLSTDKGDFFQWYPFLVERVIYLRYDIALSCDDICLRHMRNGYSIMLAKQVYHTACRISYRVSDISLKCSISMI